MTDTRLPPGAVIGRYRIETLLGAGGMGEVYRARDLELDRDVALKILPERLMADADRVRRFFSEARAASALNDAAIITIYEAGQGVVRFPSPSENESVVGFMAMELVEGETLRRHRRRPAEMGKTLEQLAAVADGLGKAHASGIVHRDLKPENIIVSRDGWPKILDFGIAKLLETRASENPVPAQQGTEPTTLLGTAGYMSPEQIQGGAVDGRSDIFSLGCVLYEVVTGEQPFRGDSTVDTMHRIVYQTPSPVRDLNPAAVPDLERIIRRCLEKNPDARYQSVRDAAIDLREAARASVPEVSGPGRRAGRRIPVLSWLVPAVVMVSLALILAFLIVRQNSVEAADSSGKVPDAIASPVDLVRVTNTGNAGPAAISGDGKYVAHVRSDGDKQSLWIKQVATGSFIQVVPPLHASYVWVSISPDSNYIYFSRADFPEFNIQNIFSVPVLGGETRKLVSNIDGCAALSSDGKRFSYARFDAVQRDRTLYLSNVDGTDERILLKRRFPFFFAWSVAWSPDGSHLAILIGRIGDDVKQGNSKDEGPSRVRLHLFVIDTSSGAIEPMLNRGFPGVGSLSWLRDGSGFVLTIAQRQQPPQIWYLPYPNGEPRKLTNDLTSYSNVSVTDDSRTIVALRGDMTTNLWIVDSNDAHHPRAITHGTNLYGLDGAPQWTADGNIITPQYDGLARLKLLSSDGQVIRTLTEKYNFGIPAVSRDGRTLAYLSDQSGTAEAWVSNIDGSNPRQITHTGRTDWVSLTPDGQSIVYVPSSENQFAWKMSIDGGKPVQITDKPTGRPSVSADGKWLLCRYRDAQPGKPLWRTALIPLDHPGPPRFIDRPIYGGGPNFAWYPDSTHFAYLDSQGGVSNIWLQNIDGSEPEQLTFFDSGDIFSFAPAPDGKRLVISRGEANSDVVMIRNFR